MRLISSREAVNFLSQAAPRPWVQRMLLWMAFDGELPAYSTHGRVLAHAAVFNFIGNLKGDAGQLPSPAMDEIIRREFEEEMANRLVGRQLHDRVDDEPVVWTQEAEPVRLDCGFLVYASYIDWDAGIIRSDFIPVDSSTREIFFSTSEDLLASEFDNPNYDVTIEGLSFEVSKVEMLLPSMSLGEKVGFTSPQRELVPRVGRPPKWDWERAMAFVVSQAQTPDGLPTGPGAQARIEEMMRDWFVADTGDAPAPSLVRQRAAKIVGMLERPKTPK